MIWGPVLTNKSTFDELVALHKAVLSCTNVHNKYSNTGLDARSTDRKRLRLVGARRLCSINHHQKSSSEGKTLLGDISWDEKTLKIFGCVYPKKTRDPNSIAIALPVIEFMFSHFAGFFDQISYSSNIAAQEISFTSIQEQSSLDFAVSWYQPTGSKISELEKFCVT